MSGRLVGRRQWHIVAVAGIALCALILAPASEATPAADAARAHASVALRAPASARARDMVVRALANARAHDSAACAPWQAADLTPSSGAFKGVAALSPLDGWAVGVQGDLVGARPPWQPITERWDGTRWSAVPSPGQGILNAVAAVAPGDAWVVGEVPGRTASQPLVQHWNGTRWMVVPAPLPANAAGAYLNGVAATSPRDAWAVGGVDGGGALIEHWDGARWSLVASPDTGLGSALAAVAVISPRDAWAVGSSASNPIVEHWNGVRWSLSTRAGYGALLAVAARSADNVWAVGHTGGQFGEPLVEHWDGKHWLIIQSPRVNTVAGGSAELAGVTVVAPGDVWAVGTIATLAVATTRALTEHWDGTRWRVTPGGPDRLAAVASAGPGAIWAVGGAAPLGTAAPLVQRYAGPMCYLLDPVQSISTVGPSPGLLAVDGATSRAFSGNLDGTVSVVDTASGQTVARVGVGRPPLAMALDATGGRVFVATDNTAMSGTVWVLDALSGTVLDLIAVGPHPTALALDQRDKRRLVECEGAPGSPGAGVGSSNSGAGVAGNPGSGNGTSAPAGSGASAGVSLVDLSQDNVVATVPMSAPGTLLLDQQHGRAVVAVRGGVVLLDVAAGTASAPIAIGTPSALALDQSAGRIFVAEPGGVNVLDATTGAIVGASDEANVSALAVDEAGGRVYAGAVAANDGAITIHVLDALSGRWLRSIDAGRQPDATISALLFDGTSRRVVVAWSGAGAGAVGIYDAASGAAINVIAGAVDPAMPVVDSTSGRLFVASSLQANHAGAPAGSGIVSVLDLVSGAVVETVPLGVAPRVVLLDGVARRLYVLDGAAANGTLNGSIDAIDADLRPGALVSLPATPADPVAPRCCAARYFAPTGHTMAGPFLTFWSANGGVDTFGYPRTEPFYEGGILVQYTDRFLLQDVSGRVSAAPLGLRLTSGRSFARVTPFVSTRERLYFPRTGHSLSWVFLRYWQAHGLRGAADPLLADPLLGAPISEVITEGNGDGSGRRYQVQWFENGRLEYHPELAGTRYAVELGLVGLQALQARGWLPPLLPPRSG